MLGNWNTEGNKSFINLKLVATPWVTEEQPKFAVLWENFEVTEESYSQMAGKLTKIKATFTPAKGRMGDVYGFKAFLEGEDAIYVVESTINNSSKDLLNALAVNLGEELKIVLYLNKNGYPTSSVKLTDGNWAQTAFEYNNLETVALYEKIASLTTEDDVAVLTEGKSEINAEDIPF